MLATAPPPPTDRPACIAHARQALLQDGMPALTPHVEPWIARSWRRCLDLGLNPAQPVVFDAVSAAALQRSQDQHRDLLRAARPVLAQLTRAIAGMRYFAMLTDARGIVVEVQGPLDRHDPRARAIGRVGIDLSEAAVGTTAIGAALTELQAVWLHRGEHFLDGNGHYSCAGAPLFDPDGQCMGMLDLTGVDVPERPELRHLVARSARAIEDAMLLQRSHALLLRVNWPGCPLGGEGDGLLALDATGCIVGSNGMARQLLPHPLRQAPLAELPAQVHCSDLMALPWTQLFDSVRQRSPGPPLDLPLWSGLRLHARAQLPGGMVARVARAPARPPATAPLREAETALIRQAVQDARGNVAEAARSLGISRATVYRKLGAGRARHG